MYRALYFLHEGCQMASSIPILCDADASSTVHSGLPSTRKLWRPEEYTLAEAVCALGWPLLAQSFRVSLAMHVAESDSWSF